MTLVFFKDLARRLGILFVVVAGAMELGRDGETEWLDRTEPARKCVSRS